MATTRNLEVTSHALNVVCNEYILIVS